MARKQAEDDLQQLKGALDILEILREEFAQWVDEAQDEAQQEALENVLAHIESLENEYRRRHDAAEGP